MMKTSTGIITGVISAGVVAIGTFAARSKKGRKIRAEFATSINNVATKLEKKADELEQSAE